MISLKEKGKKNTKFVFASMPESISVTNNTNYQSYTLIGGNTKIPKGIDTKMVTWEGVFFGRSKKEEVIVKKKYWKKPLECKKIIEKWQREGVILNLLCPEAGLNLDVTISSFLPVSYGAYGNISYSIELQKAEPLRVYVWKGSVTTKTGSSDKKEKNDTKDKQNGIKRIKPRPATLQPKTYTIVGGDNLWKIARKFYGGTGSNWKKIYDANQEAIEKAAKERGRKDSDLGYWIYPGTNLVIPEV